MQLSIDRAKPHKLYCQLLEILKEHIQNGEWKVGSQIPTEEQLAVQYDLSKATVRLAVKELVSLGYLKKIQGRGTFVRRRRADDGIAMLINFSGDDICSYSPCIFRVLENKTLRPDENVINFLNLSIEDHCFFLSKLIIVDGSPLLLQKLFISYSHISGQHDEKDTAGASPSAFIEKMCGIKIQRIKGLVDLSPLNEEDAVHLEMTPGLPVLRVRHIYYAHGDMPAGYSESFYRTEKYPWAMEFERLKI